VRLLITGDWHLDTYRPRNRTDDYFQTQFEKVKWIFGLAEEEECEGILQPGDMFNSHKANDFLKQFYIDYFLYRMTQIDRFPKMDFFTIFGQHDLRFHSSNKQNTPLRVLEAAHAITIVPNKAIFPTQFRVRHKDHYIYGCNWGEEIPELVDKDGIHILLMHKLVLEDIEGWEKKYLSVENVFRFSKHDIIVCGDNHISFMAEKFHKDKQSRLLFNCGSLMRNRIDQRNHKPKVYIVDTSDMSYEEHLIPVKPFDEVMDVEKAEQEKEKNEQLEAFVEKLSGDVNIEGLDFLRNLEAFMEENEIDVPVKEFVEEVLAWEP